MSALQSGSTWQLPLQWPQAADPARSRRQALIAARLLKAGIVFAMLALTVLDRFGLRVTDAYSIAPGLIAMYVLVAAMALGGAARLNPRGALGYVAVAGVAGLSLVINASFAPATYVSLTSFLLLIVLYAPFAVSLRSDAVTPELWRWTLQAYIAFSIFIAVAGIAQFFAQFVFQAEWLFDYRKMIPSAIRASEGWNTVYTVYSTGEWTKSNGFFLREPSIFSVAVAFALLCEMSLAARKWVMAILALGLVLSYSGSGLLCLAVGMLFPLGRSTIERAIACAVVATAAFFMFDDLLNLSYTVNRVDEFASRGSSAYCRFVYPAQAVWEQLDSDTWTGLLGHGPGTMERMGATCADGAQTTYAKILFEYGLAGMLAFAILMLGALKRAQVAIRIRVAASVAWLALGGNLLGTEDLLFIYAICAMWPERTGRAASGGGAA